MPNITAIWRQLGLTSLQEFTRREPCVCPPCHSGGSETDGYKCAHEWLILVTAEPRSSRARLTKGNERGRSVNDENSLGLKSVSKLADG